MTEPYRLALLASGRGTNVANLGERAAMGQLHGLELVLVLADRPSGALAEAERLAIDHALIDPHTFADKAAFERALLDHLKAHNVDLIALCGYMRLIGPTLLAAYPNKIINIHPSLLPQYIGKDAIARAYADGVAQSGVTVHLVDAGLDSGPILAQGVVTRRHDMSAVAFATAIHALEYRLYPQTLIAWARRQRALERIATTTPESPYQQMPREAKRHKELTL